MARSPLALAALTSSAMPELTIAAARDYSYGERGDHDAAVLIREDGAQLLVRVPLTAEADSTLAMETIALAALTAGVRSLLPFAIPGVIGQLTVPDRRLGPLRGVVVDLLPGRKFLARHLTADSALAADVARTIAAIHRVPASTVLEAGLPVRSARELRDEANGVLDRAAATRMVPATVLDRWQDIVDDAPLWQFQSTVVHGTLNDDALLVEDDRVVGVLSWAQLRVADPAADFAWLSGAAPGTMEAVINAYVDASRLAGSAGVRERATLYAELEIARWLLHGREQRDQAVIDDALLMLDTLVERIARAGGAVAEEDQDDETVRPADGAGQPERRRETGEVPSHLADTAPYDPLSDDQRATAPSSDAQEPSTRRQSESSSPSS